MCRSLIEIGWKTNKQTDEQTDRHYENNGHLAVNQKNVDPQTAGFVYESCFPEMSPSTGRHVTLMWPWAKSTHQISVKSSYDQTQLNTATWLSLRSIYSLPPSRVIAVSLAPSLRLPLSPSLSLSVVSCCCLRAAYTGDVLKRYLSRRERFHRSSWRI